ncbi:MAG: colanic acid biosynthesis glycosyltransferase WcaL [Rhodocyclaceae bacterium]|nr:MAG: colanic acid biosynthesis glycosyltransferase WcaL [Rhodocyclaceae bacterium]
MNAPHVAYFINQYPKVSHSFIRREILALERQGVIVERFALRGWADPLVDPEDIEERRRTRYLLQGGVTGLVGAAMAAFCGAPLRFLAACRLAVGVGRHADRPLPYHLIYLAEACLLLRWMRRLGVQHVHAHFGTNPAEVVMLARALGGPPYSFTVHGPEEFDKPQFIGLGEKIRRAAFVVAISDFGRSQLYRWVDRDYWPRIKVVHCGLETAFHAVAAAAPSAAPRLVCVGRLCEQKGQLLLLEAARRLADRGTAFELVLAGDGEMRAQIEALIAAYGLAGKVRITGWIGSAEVRDELLQARGLVLPSFAEGLPVVIMEAMALRRPVLTTYVAGIPELVLPGACGWLVPAGDVAALADAMAALLACPADILAAMGEAAHARVLQRHDIDKEAGKLNALLRESLPLSSPTGRSVAHVLS